MLAVLPRAWIRALALLERMPAPCYPAIFPPCSPASALPRSRRALSRVWRSIVREACQCPGQLWALPSHGSRVTIPDASFTRLEKGSADEHLWVL
ncbi:hypothetical protein GGR52DRAFT_551503, partial [Hypoxylon sp. FL1284]